MSFLTLLIFLHFLTCDLIQVTDSDTDANLMPQSYNIAVSKFCCPVCWELLKVLNETNDHNLEFVVRAHHSHLYPVCLPPWLPDHVMNRMIECFGKKLYKQLCLLPSQPASEVPRSFVPGHYKNLSLESAGGSVSSVGSTDLPNAISDQF